MEEAKGISEKVIEALSSGRCPICAMLRQDEFDGLCHWVGKSDDRDKESDDKKRLLSSGGFCNYHFWEFQGVSTHYGSASIGAELIDRLIKILRSRRHEDIVESFKERREDFKIWWLEGETHCPLCRNLKKKEKKYLKELTIILQDNIYQTRYADSCGLCMPHLIRSVDYIEDDSLAKFLFEAAIIQLEKIKTSAISFIQKKDPPFRWEQTEEEKKSWFRAIEKIVGRSGT